MPMLRPFLLTLLVLVYSAPALAIEFDSDFTDFANNWLLEAGSVMTQHADSITLAAAPVSEKERGRILIRPILATTPAEIQDLTFVLNAPDVSAPLAARAFYYDDNRNYLYSEPLFGTLQAGTIVALGTVLNPTADVRGLRVRLYSNAPTGSVTLERFRISAGSLPVPEPTSATLALLGLLGLSGAARRARASGS